MEVLLEFKWLFARFAVFFGCLALAPYILSILRGKTKPVYSTYIGWSLIGITNLCYQFKNITGEHKESLLLVATFATLPVLTLIAMWYAKVPLTWEKRDKISYAGVGISLLAWIVTYGWEDGWWVFVPLVTLALTDAFSSWPTFDECLHGRQNTSLDRISWSLTAVASLCGVVAVDAYWTLEMFIPTYLAFYMCSIALAALLVRRQVAIIECETDLQPAE